MGVRRIFSRRGQSHDPGEGHTWFLHWFLPNFRFPVGEKPKNTPYFLNFSPFSRAWGGQMPPLAWTCGRPWSHIGCSSPSSVLTRCYCGINCMCISFHIIYVLLFPAQVKGKTLVQQLSHGIFRSKTKRWLPKLEFLVFWVMTVY